MTLHAMFSGAFFGLISAVAIYHLLMYAVLRAPEFLSYGAYLAALAVFQLGASRNTSRCSGSARDR